jgi:hypothetical protein
MMIRTLIAAAAVACLAAPALAAPGPLALQTEDTITVTPVTVGARNPKDNDKSRVVCKRYVPVGSRTLGKKVCRSAGQWASEEAAAKEGLDDLTRRALQIPPRS